MLLHCIIVQTNYADLLLENHTDTLGRHIEHPADSSFFSVLTVVFEGGLWQCGYTSEPVAF